MQKTSITKEEIENWRKYFKEEGITLNVANIKALKKYMREEKRTIKRSDLYTSEEKTALLDELHRMSNTMENLVIHSEEFKKSDALESSGFLMHNSYDYLHVFPSYSITSTYRLMSKEPCISNLTPEIRSIIDGGIDYKLVSIDFRHQEPWIIVNLLEDPELLGILENHEDFYLGLLAALDIPLSPENREIAKIVWNASIYGASLDRVSGLSNDTWIDDLYRFINERERVISLRNKVSDNIKKDKSIYTRFGLERTIENSSYGGVRQGFNSIFQMSGAGVLYTGLKRIQDAIDNSDISKMRWSRIYLTLHDEFILKIPKSILESDIESFIDSIDFSIDGWTKPHIKWSIGKDWGDVS